MDKSTLPVEQNAGASGKFGDLIGRIEKAKGSDRLLDWEIHCRNSLDGVGAYGAHPNYTSSIDAAMTLVPNDLEWLVSNRARPPEAGRAYINNRELINIGRGGLTPNPKYNGAEITAATPALALCAAALTIWANKKPNPPTEK